MNKKLSKEELLRKMDEQLKDSKLTEDDSILIGEKITHKAAKRFNKLKISKTDGEKVDMIIESIKKLDGPTQNQLLKSLDKKVSNNELSKIIKDLENSGKIMIYKDGRIIWTWNPEMIKKIMSSRVKLK